KLIMKPSLLTKALSAAATFVALLSASPAILAQVKVGDNPTTINANSALEVESTNKGLLLPRLGLTATTNPAPLAAHVAGMTVFNTATANDVTPGFYYNDGTKWVATVGSSSEPNYNYTFGSGAPTGSCNSGDLYTDTLETSPTVGQQFVCSGGSWVSYTAPNRTPFYTNGTTNDAGGNKVSAISRYGAIVARNATLPMYGLLAPNGGIRLYRSSTLPAANSPTTNGYIDFTNTPSDPNPMRISMRSDASLGDLALTFQDHGTVRMAVLQNGNVGIGTGVAAPVARLHVNGIIRAISGSFTGQLSSGTSTVDGVEIYSAANDGFIAVQRDAGSNLFLTKTTASVGDRYAVFALNGQVVGNITRVASGISYNAASDIRLKENIKATRYGLGDLMKIKVADYNYKSDQKKTQTTGFLAQDLYKVYPAAVTVGGKDEKKNPWTVDYGKVTPLIVKAVQDQQAIIEKQQAEIQALKAANLAMKAENANLKAQASDVASLKAEVASIKALLGVSKEVTQKVVAK
ncbi:tail fiber domain-containing protein, partial [Spirosoma jeollabukense]